RTARTLSGMAAEQDYLTRSMEAYRQAIELYSKVLGYADAPRSLRAAQRGLAQAEHRKSELSGTPDPPPGAALPFRLAAPQALQQCPSPTRTPATGMRGAPRGGPAAAICRCSRSSRRPALRCWRLRWRMRDARACSSGLAAARRLRPST